MSQPHEQREGWIKEFDENCRNGKFAMESSDDDEDLSCYFDEEKIKSFISTLLKDQKKQLVEEIEEVLKICQKIKEIEHRKMNTAAENRVVYDVSVISLVQNIKARLYYLIEKNV
jgi:hypothetical protein